MFRWAKKAILDANKENKEFNVIKKAEQINKTYEVQRNTEADPSRASNIITSC